MKSPIFAFLLNLTLAISLPTAVFADAVYVFLDGDPENGLDGGGVGGSFAVVDPDEGINVIVTTSGIIGQDGSVDGNTTNVHGSDAFGINSADNGPITSQEVRDFNPGEAWVFSFNVDVELAEIDFAGWGGQAEITFSSTAFATDIVLNDNGDQPGSTFGLGNTLVPAGTDITMQMTSAFDPAENENGTDNSVRVKSFTVAAIPGVSTGADLIWAGASGAPWDTTSVNFTDAGNPSTFEPGDNVTIQTAGDIAIDSAGVSAGNVIDANATGAAALQGGTLTVGSFAKTGDGTLTIDSAIDASTAVGNISGGTVQISATGSLTTASLLLSGGATVSVASGGTLTTSDTVLGDGGGTINNDASLTIGSIENNFLENPLTKTGVGELTITSGIGIQTTGPVSFDILAGGVTLSGGNQANIGGTNTIDGLLSLDGSLLMLHASQLSGSGSISIQSPSTIVSRFNAGPVEVALPIELDVEPLTLQAPTANSALTLAAPITGNANITKAGNGIVVFAGANNFEGNITVEAGTLRVGRDTEGTLGEGTVFLNIPDIGTIGTLEFDRSDELLLFFPVSGVGNVVINNRATGITNMHSSVIHDYTGITTIQGGTLSIATFTNGGVPGGIGAATSAAENIVFRGGATLSYTGAAASTDRNFTLGGTENASVTGGGTVSSDGTGPLTFTSTDPIAPNGDGGAERILTLAGSAPGINTIAMPLTDGIDSVHSLVKTGTTTWQMDGTNSYTGNTSVEEGTLILSTASLADTSTISIATGAVLELTHGLGDTVVSLALDGTSVAPGTYGSSAAVAGIAGAIADDAHFSGNGYLIVNTSGASDFDTWAASFGVTGGAAADDDGDGQSNFEEYAFGLDPISGTSVTPIATSDITTGTFTFTRRDVALTGLGYVYEFSTDLQSFTAFTPDTVNSDGASPVENVTITIPTATLNVDRLYIRVRAE